MVLYTVLLSATCTPKSTISKRTINQVILWCPRIPSHSGCAQEDANELNGGKSANRYHRQKSLVLLERHRLGFVSLAHRYPQPWHRVVPDWALRYIRSHRLPRDPVEPVGQDFEQSIGNPKSDEKIVFFLFFSRAQIFRKHQPWSRAERSVSVCFSCRHFSRGSSAGTVHFAWHVKILFHGVQ